MDTNDTIIITDFKLTPSRITDSKINTKVIQLLALATKNIS